MKNLSKGDKILAISEEGNIISDEIIGFLHYKP